MATASRVEHLVSAGGVVCRLAGDEVEIAICGRRSPDGWTWALPKGTPDPGETLEETALREVTEETGLEVTLETPIDSIHYWFFRATDEVRCHKTVHFYLMRAVGGSTSHHDQEFDVVRWSPCGEALRTLTYKNEVDILKKALEMVATRSQGGRRD